ncbi:hypothetical protein C7212DRAFT_209908, partial [Tuber magnatum]
RYHTRVVTKGFLQIPSFNFADTFFSIICYESLQFLLAICAKNFWRQCRLDVKSAFFYMN